MKLYFAGPSPFARKVRVTIIEKGLSDRVENIPVNPYDLPADLVAVNPLSKVPSLVLENGTALYDSPVICEYLDSLGDDPKLLPEARSDARWTALRRIAMTDGILDQTFNIACELNRRPENERSPMWVDRWVVAITRAIAALAEEIDDFGPEISLANIGAGVALGYVDLRARDRIDWRTTHPGLADWYAEFSARPSMEATQPE